MKIPVALQMYSLRDFSSTDMIGCLEKVKEAGYDSVEFAGYGDFSASQLRKELDRIGLAPLASHVGFSKLETNLQAVLDYSLELGLKYIVCPGADLSSLDSINKTAEVLSRAAELFSKHGIRLGYHNHHHEFNKLNGQYILDILMEKTRNHGVFAEIDTYWVKYAGLDPLSYIRSLGDRVVLYHFKDMLFDDKDRGVAVGEGNIDFSSIVKHIYEAGYECGGIIVEQESFDDDPFDSIARSCRNIRKMLEEV